MKLWKQSIKKIVFLCGLLLSVTLQATQVLADQVDPVFSSEETLKEASSIKKEADSTRVELVPNKKFEGNVGDHPLLESFGDVENQGVLAGTARDLGRLRVIPYPSKTTPNRQMAMKIGDFGMADSKTYPDDQRKVANLVNGSAIDFNYYSVLWGGTSMSSASVGISTNNGRSFYDVAMDEKTGGIKSLLRGYPISYPITATLMVGQGGETPSYAFANNDRLRWDYQIEDPHGIAFGGGTFIQNDVVLMKMYNHPTLPYSVAYGAHVQKKTHSYGLFDLLGYVRIIMQPVNAEGRVRMSYSYVNLTTDPNRSNSSLYASYGKKLTDTRSLGNDKGEYFITDNANDGYKGYAYLIYRDEYPAISAERPVNSPQGRVLRSSGLNTDFNPGISPADPGEGVPFTNKNLGYTFKKTATPLGQVANWDMDFQGYSVHTLTVKHLLKGSTTNLAPQETFSGLYSKPYTTKPKAINLYRPVEPMPENASGIYDGKDVTVTYYYELIPTEGTVTSRYLDVNGVEISKNEVLKGKIDTNYEVKPKNIDGYVYAKTEGDSKGLIKEGNQTATFVYLNQAAAYELKQEVVNSLNESVDQGKAKQGEKLTYRLKVDTVKELAEVDYLYQAVTITEKVDSLLENVEKVELKNAAGTIVGTGTYDSVSRNVIGKLTNLTLAVSQGLELTYQATIKKEAKVSSKILEKGVVDVSLKLGTLLTKTVKLTSNEVVTEIESGMLEVVSAPVEMNFGTVSIRDFQKKVSLDKGHISDPLVIADNRITRKKWDVVATVVKEMTNGDDSQTGALKYVYKNEEMTLNSGPQVIYENDGQSPEILYNITDSWGKETLADGLKLKISSSKVPKTVGNYEGIIRWTLRETIE